MSDGMTDCYYEEQREKRLKKEVDMKLKGRIDCARLDNIYYEIGKTVCVLVGMVEEARKP